MFDFLTKAKSTSTRPTRKVLQTELGKNDAFASLTEQAQKDVLDALDKAGEVDFFDHLHTLRAMTSASRDQVVAKLLHPEAQAQATAQKKYTVVAGDSMSKIAKAHGMSMDQMIAANPQVKNPNLIHPQDVLNLA